MQYRLNEPDVIQETVDGETLIVNTRTGTYYNVGGSGAQVWNALIQGRSAEQAAGGFAANDESQRAFIRSGIGTFVETLLAERLILPASRAAGESDGTSEPAASERPSFCTPELRKFTDMQELLLVDPIHEVDPAAGWPLPKDPNKAD